MREGSGLVASCSVFALAAVALAACGSSSFLGADSPTDTVRTFLEAAAARDGPSACGLLNGHGQQLMGVYPQRFGSPGAHQRSCQQTVSRLGELPHSEDWEQMARGTICVYGTGGRDSQAIVVIYKRRGARATAGGSVQANLGPGYRIMVPPTPASADVGAASPPPGNPRCSRGAG
jgi:hypothetical protein